MADSQTEGMGAWASYANPTTAADRINFFLHNQAPEWDLVGDIDPWGILPILAERDDVKSLDDLLALYYEDVVQPVLDLDTPASAPCPFVVEPLVRRRADALERFLRPRHRPRPRALRPDPVISPRLLEIAPKASRSSAELAIPDASQTPTSTTRSIGQVVENGEATAGNIVGVDPHRKTCTATVLDERGGELAHAHFANGGEGHAQATARATQFGPVDRWGIEGACGLGRDLAEFLVSAGCDVRDVPPHKTSVRQRGRYEGKTDRLDSHRIAQETQTNPRLSRAFKHSQPAAPDPIRELIALWHKARTSLTKIGVHLLGEFDALIQNLPEQLRTQLSAATVRARVNAYAQLDTSTITNETVQLRLRLIEHRITMLRDVLDQDKAATAELANLVDQSNTTFTELVGIAQRAAAEIIIEVGDVRRFTEAGFARFNGTAPIPASSAEADGDPVRHRLSREATADSTPAFTAWR